MMKHYVCRHFRQGRTSGLTTRGTSSMTTNFRARRFRNTMRNNTNVIHRISERLHSTTILRLRSRYLTMTRSTTSRASFLNSIINCLRAKNVRISVVNCRERTDASNCHTYNKVAFNEARIKVPFQGLCLFYRALRLSFASDYRIFPIKNEDKLFMRRGKGVMATDGLLTRFFKRNGNFFRHRPPSKGGERCVCDARAEILPLVIVRVCRLCHCTSDFRRNVAGQFEFTRCNRRRTIVIFVITMVRRFRALFTPGEDRCLVCLLRVTSFARVKSTFRGLVRGTLWGGVCVL